MEEERIKYFRSLDDKAIQDLRAVNFTKTEIVDIINETCLSDFQINLALDYFVHKKTYKEIANTYYFDERTIKTKLGEISIQLILTCHKKFAEVVK